MSTPRRSMPDFKAKVVLDRQSDHKSLPKVSREYGIKDTVLSSLEVGVLRSVPDGPVAGAGRRPAG